MEKKKNGGDLSPGFSLEGFLWVTRPPHPPTTLHPPHLCWKKKKKICRAFPLTFSPPHVILAEVELRSLEVQAQNLGRDSGGNE